MYKLKTTINQEIFVPAKFRNLIFVHKYFRIPANHPKIQGTEKFAVRT